MFFDNASLFIGLYASYMARWRGDSLFTYGYGRYEVLAGFVNAVFLVFVGLSVVAEAVERLWEPPEIHGEHLLTVSVLGLLVNIVGLVFFHDVAHAHGHGGGGGGGGDAGCEGGGGEHHGHSHGGGANENMYGVYLHVLADALGSVGVIISSLMIKYWGWQLADPVASIIISGLVLLSVAPLLGATVGPLLSRVPEGMEDRVRRARFALERHPDVARVEQLHVWKLRGDTVVGTLHVACRAGADVDEQRVLRKVKEVMAAAGVTQLCCQVERDDAAASSSSSSSASSSLAASDGGGRGE